MGSGVSAHDPYLADADSSDESDSSEESDIDSETSSALFMAVRVRRSPGPGGDDVRALRLTSQPLQKKKTPPKRERKPSGGSSKGTSRPGTPSAEAASTSSTLRAAASKLEQGECWEKPVLEAELRAARPFCAPVSPMWTPQS